MNQQNDLLLMDESGDGDGDFSCSKDEELVTARAEWFEDAESEAEWIDSIPISTEWSTESINLSLPTKKDDDGDGNGDGDVDGDADDENELVDDSELCVKNKFLERQLKEMEKKFENLQVENERLNIQLTEEKQKGAKCQKKIKFIQDNQEIFGRLKQAYISMKYNEAVGRPMVEVSEKGSQTWSGILCKACIESAEKNRQKQFEELCNFASGAVDDKPVIAVKKSDLTKIEGTIKTLREMIEKREQSWSYNREREDHLKNNISELELENKRLREVLRTQGLQVKPTRTCSNQTEFSFKETGALKKIIVKLEKRNREMNSTNLYPKFPTSLNEKEVEIIDQIMNKYYKRLQKQNEAGNMRSRSCDRATSSKSKLHPSHVPRAFRNEKSSLARGDNEKMLLRASEHDLIDFTEDFPTNITPSKDAKQ